MLLYRLCMLLLDGPLPSPPPTPPRTQPDPAPAPSTSPVPQLLGGLLEVNIGYVADVEAMGLAAQFFDFLSLEHSNNNVHNIRLCRQVISAGSMPASQLLAMQVSEKVGGWVAGRRVQAHASTRARPFLLLLLPGALAGL